MKKCITAFLLASAMAGTLLLGGCDDSKPGPEMSRVTNVYSSVDIPLPENYGVRGMYAVGENILVDCAYTVSENPYTEGRVLLSLDDASGDYTEIQLPQYDSEKQQIYNICPADDGSIVLSTVHTDYEAETYYYDIQRYAGGECTVLCADLEAVFESDPSESIFGGGFYIQEIAVDGAGNIYVVTDTLIGVFDRDMKKLFELSFDHYIDDVGVSADGRVYVSYRDADTFRSMFRYIDVEKRALGEDVPMPDVNLDNVKLYIGPGYDIYYDDGSAVYGYSGATDTAEERNDKLLDYINSDIIQNGVQGLVVIDADTFLVNYYEYREENSIRELYLMKRVPDEEVPERYVIDYAVNYGSYDVADQVVRFNRSSDTYRVRLTEYSSFNTDGNYGLAEEALLNDYTAGNGPDIVMLSEFANRNELLENELFLDLYSLMEEDDEFDPSVLFDCVLEPMERGGELHELVTVLSLRTLAGKRANIPCEGWSASGFLDFAKSVPEDKYILDYTDQRAMFNTLMTLSLGSFADRENGTVNFDVPEFRELLEYAKNTEEFSYYSTLSGDELAEYERDRSRVYREDTVLLSDVYLHSPTDAVAAMFTFGFDDTVFVGYPTARGNGAVLEPTVSLAVSKDSPVAEGAWEFIKSTLYNDTRYGRHRISSVRENFRAAAEADMEMHYFYSFDGGVSGSTADDFLTRYSEAEGIYRDVTAEDIRLMESLIDGAAPVPSYYYTLMELISEDLEMYFSGEKNIDETVNIINSRAGIYIAENS